MRLWIIIGIVMLNSIGMSIILPLLPFIVGKFLPSQQVVIGMSTLMSVFAACTFFAAPFLGALSDRYGRRIILIISLLGSVIGYIFFGIGGSLGILFLGRIIDGLTEGNITTLFAYVADSTAPKDRAKWFGYISSAMGIGKLGGPALGGFLGSISLALPFYVTAGLIFISSIAVYFLLPESLPALKRTTHITVKSIQFKDIIKEVKPLLILGMLFYAGQGIFQFNFILFLKDIYKWGPTFIGTMLTLIGIFDILSRAVLLPWLLKKLHQRTIAIAGLIGLATGLAFVALGSIMLSVIIISLAIIFIIMGAGLFEPLYNGLLSRSVDESKQGKLQGLNQSLQSANNMLIPLGAAAIYFYSPGMLYVTAAMIIVGAVFIRT